jgi:hypothetical protein
MSYYTPEMEKRHQKMFKNVMVGSTIVGVAAIVIVALMAIFLV